METASLTNREGSNRYVWESGATEIETKHWKPRKMRTFGSTDSIVGNVTKKLGVIKYVD